ncbi:MAG TPA: hypothetical protein VJ085_07935 [Candidatus Acidoferrales bacterium]|nr:hypothetical protein [Candidatus Acidoferrales bacterium]
MGRKASAFLALLSISLLLSACIFRRPQRYSDFITPTPLPPDQYLVIGFLGGRQPWNNAKEGTRRLALELIRNAFDRNQDGRLDEAERQRVRLILYGQSFGGAAVVKLARELHALDIPVLLTVQIDSVGREDAEIPANVQAAANLFQHDGRLIRGEAEIRAEDLQKTKILGNFRFSYQDKQVDMSDVTWHKRIFRDAHAKMDRDTEVWTQVEELIVAAIKEKAEPSTAKPLQPD